MNTRTRTLNSSSELHIPEDGPVLLQFRPWTSENHSQEVSHAFTTRRSTWEDREEVDMMEHSEAEPERIEKSRNAVLSSNLIPDQPVIRPEQVHGGRVRWIEPDSSESNDLPPVSILPDVDGVLTRSDRVVLMAHSADCPIVFLYPVAGRGVTGLLHASWKGISHGILRNAIQNVVEHTCMDPRELRSAISPSIHPCCYEVKSDFRSTMLEREPITRPCFLNREDKLFFDLQQAIHRQLEDAGLPGEQIIDAGLCSYCREDLFYSYRRNGITTGRTAGLVSLNGTT